MHTYRRTHARTHSCVRVCVCVCVCVCAQCDAHTLSALIELNAESLDLSAFQLSQSWYEII